MLEADSIRMMVNTGYKKFALLSCNYSCLSRVVKLVCIREMTEEVIGFGFSNFVYPILKWTVDVVYIKKNVNFVIQARQ